MQTTTRATTKNSKQSRREQKMEEARAVLEQGLEDVREDPETLAAYLRFRAHFRSYSIQNTLMIRQQRPSARYVMGYRQWQQNGRQVMKGESGLMIWLPLLRKPREEDIEEGADPDRKVLYGWRVGHVFSYSQTKATSDDALEYVSPIPQLDVEDCAHLYDKLKRVATGIGYEVILDSATTTEGYCAFRRRQIGIRAGMTPASSAATLAHELAHALAHDPDDEESSERIRHAARELQAEGAAYLACYTLGLDTSRASLPYLKHYERDNESLEAHLKAIDQIAWRIVDAV